jgi:hypothetical protein
MPILVKAQFDYADEFDCYEFNVFETQEKFDKWVEDVKSNIDNERTEFYFGTNEYIEIENMEDFHRGIEVQTISEEEYAVFRKYFRGSFGTGPMFSIDNYKHYE